MNVIRWILSNIILILFVLALTYAYVYWDNLTGEDTPAGQVVAWLSDEFDSVREFVEDLREDGESETQPAEAAASTAEASADTVEMAESDTADTGESAAERFAKAESTRTVSQPVPSPVPQKTSPQASKQTSQQATRQEVAPSKPPASPDSADAGGMTMAVADQQSGQPETTAPQAPQQQPAAAQPAKSSEGGMDGGQAGGGVAASKPKPESSPAGKSESPKSEPGVRELWIDARNEYLDGDYNASIRNYQKVIERSEDNYDAWGELGNVYYRQRNYEKAADAYFRAAEILVNQGQAQRASTLRPILSRLDREKSEQLQQLIRSSR